MAEAGKVDTEDATENAADDMADESDSEESDYEELTEPKLKYERISNDLVNILSKDAASCMAVHPKFLALGTHWGMIHILDHGGNNISSKELSVHTTTVNQISIDSNGDYISSCSDDGRVVINGLYSTDNNQVINFDRPVKAVAMDPMFFKPGSGKHFVTGDDKLLLHEKGFLNRHKHAVIHQGEGPIRSIKWTDVFIAWANDQGVKIYDMSSRRRITYISRENQTLRPDMYRCNLCWKDSRTLLIGWGDSIKICVVKEREQPDVRDLPNRYVEIVAMFSVDFYVCGIAPHGENLVVLTYNEEEVEHEAGKMVASRPHLRLIEPSMDTYTEVSNDALSIRGFQEYRCNDYHLECLVEENLYFIVSPKDTVIARPRDHDDHIAWLLEHQLYERAMIAAQENQKDLKRHSFQDIGREYLNYLLEERRYDDAAQLCIKILARNKELWEEEVFKFAQIRQLKAIAPYLPRGEPKLSPSIYEMVLNEFLHTDHVGFEKLIRAWPSDLYSIQAIVTAVTSKLERDPNNRVLLHCLADLYSYDKRYDKALYMYLRLKHEGVFELIHKHDLFDAITDKIEQLMEFRCEAAVKLLLDNMDKVPPEKVVKQLDKSPALLHVYLDRLFQKDAHLGQDFHARQVALYAEYDPPRLMRFLRSSNYYPLQGALDICQERALTPEMVFLLGRMGNTKQALQLITNDLQDACQAIEFCKEHNDPELWLDLINYSVDKPGFITALLQNIGTHVDPILLVQKIPDDVEIPGLRDSLVKILQDYHLQISLQEGCKKILVSDGLSLLERLIKTQKRGIFVDDDQVCQACLNRIIEKDLRYATNIKVFNCRHAFHEDCLPYQNLESCSICSAQKRGPAGLPSTNTRR